MATRDYVRPRHDHAGAHVHHVLLLHHAQGLTDGLRAFADRLRAAGHDVTAPDLYDGRTFPTVDEGVQHATSLGFSALVDAGVAAAEGLPDDLVTIGFSLGCMPAQSLAQNRPGVRGCVLLHGAAEVDAFGGTWPDGVPSQVHVMQDDPWEDLAHVRAAAAQIGAELFVYEGDAHLFLDASVPDHRPEAAALATDRILAFLSSLDRAGTEP